MTGAADSAARAAVPTPPGWPPPERMAAIIGAIRRQVATYRAEIEGRDGVGGPGDGNG